MHIRQQHDFAVAFGYSLRTNLPTVVDHRIKHLVGRVGGEVNTAAIGLDRAVVFHQGIEFALLDGEVDQTVAGKVELNFLPGCHGNAAQIRPDHPFITHLSAEHHHRAAISIDGAAVDHRLIAAALKTVVAVDKVLIVDIQRGGHQAADVDVGPFGKQHAVLVDQKHLAGGIEVAVNRRGVVAGNAIERHGGAAVLVEVDGVAFTDAERLPVDNGLV